MQKRIFATTVTISAVIAAIIVAAGVLAIPPKTSMAGSTQELQSSPSSSLSTGDGSTIIAGNNASGPDVRTLNGIGLSFALSPNSPQKSDLTTMTMNVTDAKSGIPLTHVDWLIKIITPSGKQVFESATQHSHAGKMQLSYAFQEAGNNTVSVHVASLGPKMLGMDVPKMAQTRILKSGDMMKSPDVDPTDFFGTREANFTVNVQPTTTTTSGLSGLSSSNSSQQSNGGSVGSTNQTGLAQADTTTTANGTSTVLLDGSEPNTKVKLEFLTNPQNVTAGQPATLVLRTKIAENDSMTTHVDGLFTISKEDGTKLLESGPKGNPMMPMNGAFHGHTGEIALRVVFPEPGQYTFNATENSDPKTVSNYVFGNLQPALFKVNVGAASNESAATNATAAPSTGQPNHISIIGQEKPYYSPSELKASAGTPIIVTNDDAIAHTVTSTDANPAEQSPTASGTFDTGILGAGQEKQITIDKEGTYNYFCQIHPFMRGSITVTS